MNPGNSHVVDLSGNSISIVVNSNSEKIGVKEGQDVYLECIEPTSEQNDLSYDVVFKRNGNIIHQKLSSNSLHLNDVTKLTDGVSIRNGEGEAMFFFYNPICSYGGRRF